MHLLGKRLKSLTKVKWLADFRDPWTDLYFNKDFKQLTRVKQRNKNLEIEVLKQAEGSPLSVEKQIAIIYLGTKGLLRKIPVKMVRTFEEEYLNFLDAQHRDVLDTLKAGKLTSAVTDTLEQVAAELSEKYQTA